MLHIISISKLKLQWCLLIIVLFHDKLMCIHLNVSMFQLRELCKLEDQSAEYEMEIQTILTGILPLHN
jgi:predicted cation transporter